MTENTTSSATSGGLSKAERDAARARAKELRDEAKAGRNRAAGEKALREAIAAMPEADRVLAERIDEIVTRTAPDLMPKTWYGMPAYARDGKVVCFFQGASKFGSRYSTFGFTDVANLDEGVIWPTAFALTKLTAGAEKQIAALVARSVS